MADGTSSSRRSESSLDYQPLDAHHIGRESNQVHRSGRSRTRSSVEGSDHAGTRRPPRRSDASTSNQRNTYSSSTFTSENPSAYLGQAHEHGTVRTLPPWIDSFERGDDEISQPTDTLLAPPSQAHSAQHHFDATKLERRVSKDGWVDDDDRSSPGAAEKLPERTLFGKAKEPVRGRRWDHVRDREPVISRAAASQPASPWRNFVKSSAYGPAIDEDGKTVDPSFLDQQTPGYSRPWRGDVE